MKLAEGRLRQRGFSLLEAIVALVLLSTTGMALFSWINSTLSGLNHALESTQKIQFRKNALALMQQVNPAIAKTGEMTGAGFTLNWQATAITPLKQEITFNGTQGPYLLGLFDSQVTLSKDGSVIDDFKLRQIGYQLVQ